MKFTTTKQDFKVITEIVERATKHYEHLDRMELLMDISACHANGMPLRLNKLLTADNLTFFHDIGGIRRHINRKTGKLEQCFVPRCAA